MSDTMDDYKALNDMRDEERRLRREAAPAKLDEAGLGFSEHNGGAHLIVYGKRDTADFWPGTSRWFLRIAKVKGFGIDKLIRVLG